VYCDIKATTGAVLYWMTERDLQRALLEHSKLSSRPLGGTRYSLPGWESVQKALEFLKAAARLGDA
jgi:hypothetical protein